MSVQRYDFVEDTMEPADAGTWVAFDDVAHLFELQTLRDYFAAHAPSHRVDFPNYGMAAEFAGVPEPEEGDIEAAARLSAAIQSRLAFMYADAMLAERSK